jgi:hypothetical protein
MAKKKKNPPADSKRPLTIRRRQGNVRMVREIIIRRMAELDWSAYRLAKEVEGRMTAQTVYDYVADPQRTKINDEFVAYLLDALGLEIRPKE